MFGIVSSLILLVSSIAILIGSIALVKFSKNAPRKALKKYKYKITARVVDKQKFDTHNNYYNSMDAYASVYEYMYGGRYYRVVSKFSSTHNNDQIGATKTIYVNPDNPEDIYEPSVANVLSIMGLIIGIVFIIAGSLAVLMCIGVLLTAATDFGTDYEDVTTVVMGIVLGVMVFKMLVIIACLASVYFVNKYCKKKSERCNREIYATVVDKSNGYFANIGNMNSKVLEYTFGQIYQKPLPEILGMILLKINTLGMRIFINPNKPTEIYHPIMRKIVMTVVCVVAGAIAVAVFGSLLYEFMDVLEMYGFGF